MECGKVADLNSLTGEPDKLSDRSRRDLPRVLILGGTGEGAELSARLVHRPDLSVTSSLAGRVLEMKHPEGEVRVGGFGGVDGLVAYLLRENIKVVVDATHPFAVGISHNVEAACAVLGLQLIAFNRPQWERTEEDSWYEVDDFKHAADFVGQRNWRVLLTIGRQEVGSFARCKNAWFLIRSIDKPTGALPPRHEVLLRRGPFDFNDERRLLEEQSIDYLVSKNSGGPATSSKILAARALGIPVVMIKRPVKQSVPTLDTVDEVISVIDHSIRFGL